MFKLKYLEIHNFFSFESCAIRFTSGLTLISGYDEGGKDSNGCGKSTILNAIAFALFGRTLKGVSGIDVVRWGQKDCKVILLMTKGADVYEIERTISTLIFKINGSAIRGHKLDIQHSIEDTCKSNYSLFVRSTAFSQGQVEFLGASSDLEKKKLFKEVLSLSRLDKAYDKAKIRYDEQYNKAARLEGEIGATSWRKNDLELKIYNTEIQKGKWESDIELKIENLRVGQQRTPPPAESIRREVKSIEDKLKDLQNVGEDILEYEKKVHASAFDDTQYAQEIDKIWALIQKGQDLGQRCEVCGTVVNKKMLGAHQRELEEKIESLNKHRTEVAKERFVSQEYLKYLYQTRAHKDLLSANLESSKRDLAINEMEWEHYRERCDSIDKQVKEVQSNGNPYSDILDNLNTELRSVDSKLDTIQEEFTKAKANIDVLSFIKFTLSREGAVGHIIEREFTTLVSYSNRMLSEISGGRLRVSISPQRELKSGALKEEIDINVYANDQRTTYWGLSDGQRQRVNIALLLALNKLCKTKGVNSFDFLLLDEVLDISLAEGGQQDVIFLLKNYLRECSSIILISHKETFKASFNSCISVYRDSDGISRLGR